MWGDRVPCEAINGASQILKRQECVQSRWKDATTWERSLSMQGFGEGIKTPLSLEKKELEFWGAIVGVGSPSRRLGIWAMPKDDNTP